MAFDEKKFVGTDALSELSTKVKTELYKKTDKAGALTNVSYDTTNKKLTKTTQGAHDPVTTDIVTTSTLKNDMGIADFDGTFNSLKSKPTTISGYGITDAKVQNSTVTIGSNSVTALTQEDVSSTYDSSGTSPVDGKAIAAALGTLDVESVGGTGKYISAISETDGKISATAETMDSTPTSNSTKAVTSDGIYEYVNSSVATNTAYFIGTFDSVEELEAYSGIITNNDYAFVTSTDSSGNTLYNRYKYNGSTQTWSFEYALNNSSFTSAQWATIQSGLTASDKTKLDGIQSGANKTIVDAAMSSSSTNPVQNKVVNTALAGKQNTLTFDSTPTQSSTNPVTSAGIYTDQARQDALEAQDRAALIEVENKGAKNLLQNSLSSGTVKGITYTINADGSITTTAGTASGGNSNLVIYFDLEPGVYVVSGCPNGGSSTTYRAQVLDNTTSTSVALVTDSTMGAEFEVVSGHEYAWRFRVQENKSIPDATFYPMICSKAEWDISNAFAPYGKTNADLTAEADYAVNTGTKNILKVTAKSGSSYGLTREVSDDGTITLTTGQAQNNPTLVGVSSEIVIPKGNWILSGCPSGGSDSTYRLDIRISGTATVLAVDTGGGGNLVLSGDTTCSVFIRVAYNYSVSNLVFKPMIRLASITDSTFVPYALSNPVLTPALIEQVDNGVKNLLNTVYLNAASTAGVTIADNGDGTYSLSGTATATADYLHTSSAETTNMFGLKSGEKYCISAGLSQVKIRIDYSTNGTSWNNGGGDGLVVNEQGFAEFIIPSGAVGLYIRFRSTAADGSLNGKTLSPMICTKAAWDVSHQYVPYKQNIVWGLGDKIQQNSDFNSYTKPGVYRVENSTDAATMLHIPVTGGGGRLEVSIGDTSTEILHTYFSGNAEYRRSYNGTTWSDWVQILSTATLDEIPTANSTNAVMSKGVQAPLAELVDNGAKNLLKNEIGSGSRFGLPYTTGADGSIVITGGTPTNNADFTIPFTPKESGQYVLQGCPNGGSGTTYKGQIVLYPSMANVVSIFENTSATASLTGGTQYAYRFRVYANKSIGDVTIYPMVCTKAAWDISHQYVPYTLPNPVITPALIEQVDGGAKNVLNSIATTGSSGSLSWTAASDGTITVNGTNDTGGRVDIHLFGIGYLPNTYSGMILSGCKNGQSSSYYILALYSNDGIAWESEKAQYDAPIIIGDSPYCRISIMVPKDSTLNNVVFKPMICTLADWNVSQKYVPYCPSLQDLAVQKVTNVVTGTTTLSGTGVSIALAGGNIYRLTASAKYKAVNLSEIAIKYTISGTEYSVCSNSMTPTNNVVYLTTTGLITPSSNITVEAYVKTETSGNVEILLLAEKIYAI